MVSSGHEVQLDLLLRVQMFTCELYMSKLPLHSTETQEIPPQGISDWLSGIFRYISQRISHHFKYQEAFSQI